MNKYEAQSSLYEFLVDNGYQEDDSEKMVDAYFSKPTGGILRAANVIEDFDDDVNDYTSELIDNIQAWQRSWHIDSR